MSLKKTILVFIVLFLLPKYAFSQLDVVGFAIKAEQFKKSKNYHNAIKEYDKAHKAAPSNHEYLVEKSKCFYMLKDYESAAYNLEKAVHIKSDDLEMVISLAKLYGQLGNLNKTIEYLQKAYLLDANILHKKQIKNQVIRMLQNKKLFAEADRHLAELTEKFPDDDENWYNAAQNANSANNYHKAIYYAEVPIKKNHSLDHLAAAKYHFELAFAYFKLENYAKSREHTEKANYGVFKPRLLRFTADYQCAIALAYLKMYDYENAKLYLLKAQKIHDGNPKIAETYTLMAEMLSSKAPLIETHCKAANTESIAHRKMEHLMKLTQFLLENKKYAESLNFAEECILIAPLQYHAYFFKAMALRGLGKENESLLQLKQISNLPELTPEQRSLYAFAIGVIHYSTHEKDASESFLMKVSANPYKFAAVDLLEKNRDKKH